MDEPNRAPRPLAWAPVAAFALAFVVVELALSARYGPHRDELYFLSASRRLAWGYVDQPPMVAGLGWVAVHVLGGSLTAVRACSAVFGGLTVLASAAVAAELGASRRAQTLVAGITAGAPVLLGSMHLLTTTAFDLLAWNVLTLLAIRLLRGADPRWWLAVGTLAGVALLNKAMPVFWAFGLAAGIVGTRRWAVLRTPWPWAGALIAGAIVSPYLLWQADHDWPQLEMSRSLREDHGGVGGFADYVIGQPLLLGVLVCGVWLVGLVALLRDPRFAPWRWAGISWVAMFALFAASGAKDYYLAGAYAPLLAAGAIRWDERSRRHLLVPSLAALSAATAAPIALPLLPASALADVPLQKVNYDLGEQIAWPRYVAQVAAVRDALPASERASAVVLTVNYGEYGAIERWGGRYRLGTPISGHNSAWWWGSGPAGVHPTIVVGYQPEWLGDWCVSSSVAGHLDNGLDVDDEEQAAPIIVCQPRRPWSDIWDDVRHYG